MPKNVLINKKELLEMLKTNLELHKTVYKEAADNFQGNYASELLKMADIAVKENKFIMQVNLEHPENHEADYDAAIKMIEVDCRDQIELDFEEFAQFYMNKWHWITRFQACYISNRGYSGYSGYSPKASSYFKT